WFNSMIIEDEALRSLYQATGIERLQKLQTGLLQLEQDPHSPATLADLQRELHSLKGDSNSVGLDAIAQLAQQLEAIINAVEVQTIAFSLDVSDRLYQGLYTIEQLVHTAVTGESDGVEVDQTLALLQGVLDGAIPTAPTVPLTASAPLYIDDDELREIYRTTSESRLQTLEFSLTQLEQGPDDAATLEVLRRETHSLKGDSRAVGLEPVAGLTQSIETLIKDLKSEVMPFTAEVSDCLAQGVGVIRQLVAEAVSGEASGVDIAQVSDRLFEVAATAALSSPDAPALPPALPVDLSISPTAQPVISDSEDAELLAIYRTTSEERLQRLEASLLHLEKHPHDEATLAALMREAHSLKGDAGSTGIDAVKSLAHAVEDILIGIQRRTLELDSTISDRLYQGLDAIGQLVQAATTGAAVTVDADQHLQALRGIAPAPAEDAPQPAAIATETIAQVVPTPGRQEVGGLERETVRVETRELDALMAQAEDLAVTRIQISQTATQTQQLTALWEEWQANKHKPQTAEPPDPPYEERLADLLLNLRATVQDNSSKLERVAEDLRERIRKLQLLPLSTLFQPLPRVVRDLAKQQSKAVNLILEGEDTLADKRILEGIKDSLMHLVRNAIDHGIEDPDEREAAGKSPIATLRVRAYQTAVSLTIEIQDDGQGLDIEKIKRTALKQGLYAREDLATMSVSQIQRLILAPGFSTRSFITEISGRGVGLDVVQTQVERLKGSIQIESTPGAGSIFRLQLSTSLSTANVVLVEAQGMKFAVPIEFLQMTLLVAPDQINTVEGQDTLTLDGQTIPVTNLVDGLALAQSPTYSWVTRSRQQVGDRRPCVLLKVGHEQAGFFVDQLIDQLEVVSKPLSPMLKRVRNVTGATILGTGEICIILNPPDMLKSLQQRPTSAIPTSAQQTAQRKPIILLVEDSPPVRIQEKRLFEGAGYEVVTATNGLEGYNTLQTRTFDAVVSDVEMPYLDGFSLVTKIRQHPEHDDLPIILVTTLDSDADRKRGADAGANAHILKGRFNQEALLETLERLI
ncbi:MAG: Hpt domain-containing protein, partial [Cyanobacteria bacterium J06642_9]